MRNLTGSELAEERARLQRTDALMYTRTTPGGSTTVNCPYCLIHGKLENPVDITRWLDTDGKRERKVTCSKGHDLRFRTMDEWREARQRVGLQARG